MHNKETIVLIGTGKDGSLAAELLSAGRYKLLLCDKDFAQAQELAHTLISAGKGCDAEAVECSFNCAWEADMIILALAFDEQMEAARYIKDVVNQKILISLQVNASKNLGDENASVEQQMEQLQEELPYTKIAIVKLAAKEGHIPLKVNTSQYIEVFAREPNTLEAVADLFKNSGVPEIKKELLPLSSDALFTNAASTNVNIR
jgi:hypothetical protein